MTPACSGVGFRMIPPMPSPAATASADPADPCRIHRFEVRPAEGEIDPRGQSVLTAAREALGPGITGVHTASIYLVEADLTEDQRQRLADELLADPINQTCLPAGDLGTPSASARTVEVHYLPGVMDPVAESTQDAIAEMFPQLATVRVRTGTRYDLVGGQDIADDQLEAFAYGHLGNPVVQQVNLKPYCPDRFPVGQPYDFELRHIPLRDLDDRELEKLSRQAHLFLSLEEMRAIRAHYRNLPDGREPTDIELETLAQTWSEHCVHKTLKSTIQYTQAGHTAAADDPIFTGKAGHAVNPDGSVTIHNLLKSTVAAATFDLKNLWQGTDRADWLVSVFDDNAGIVRFDQTHGIAIKVETHNHPSALEPYGGAATGIGGCIRDIMGTGLSAKPIANTNVFCVAPPSQSADELPGGVIPPRRTLQRVVDGVRDYGNRMGIPTVNGAVYFHPDYLANPLVYAGCVGLIPLDKCFGEAQPGDRIIILGGETGRDGIHGATFSSAELTDTHADEFSHAVQIGNAITQKKTLDVILQARDYHPTQDHQVTDPTGGDRAAGRCLFHAISDCGAGGFSSAVGEMAEKIGATVTLDTAPLKYDGLTYTEVWISEAQERMPLAVPPENVPALRALAEAEGVPFCDLGEFGHRDPDTQQPTLRLLWQDQQVGHLPMAFMHDGLPTPTRTASWPPPTRTDTHHKSSPEKQDSSKPPSEPTLEHQLLTLLAHPNLASKHWIVRQYDHEVQAGSVVKPLVGSEQDGPSDGAVLRPKFDSDRGITLSNGLAPMLSEKSRDDGTSVDGDSYYATLAALDEAVRNAVCVGADPRHLAILDNFCWPRCDDPAQLGSLVRAAEACYDGAMAYQTPFVSGKDSLSNQFTTEDGRLITIPPTMLISALGMLSDVTAALTMDAKAAGNHLLLVGQTQPMLGGSHLLACGLGPADADRRIPRVDLEAGPRHAAAVAELIARRWVASAHDCSEGGLLPAAAEMAFAGRVGLDLQLAELLAGDRLDAVTACFAETPSRYLLEVTSQHLASVTEKLRCGGVAMAHLGRFGEHDRLTLRPRKDAEPLLDVDLTTLRQAWQAPLDW